MTPVGLVRHHAAHLTLKLTRSRKSLRCLPLRERVEHVLGVLDSDIDLVAGREAHPRPGQEADWSAASAKYYLILNR